MVDAPVSFVAAPMVEIVAYVQRAVGEGADAVTFIVADPMAFAGRHAGETIDASGRRHRPYRVWVDLAARVGWRLDRMVAVGDAELLVRLCRLPDEIVVEVDDVREKYGTASAFARIDKTEEPSFVLDFADAIERTRVTVTDRVLVLGCNRGDEVALLCRMVPGLHHGGEVVGIDHCASAIEHARTRFAGTGHRFVCEDVARLPELDIGRFGLILSIDTLHSPGIDDRAVLRHLVQDRIHPTGSFVLAFPNCRYHDGELLPGARTKNFTQPELGVLVRNVAHYRRYLGQHRRKVYVTGSHEVFVTAVPW